MSRYVLLVHIYPHTKKTSYYWRLMKNWSIIFIVGPTSALDNGSGDLATASEDLYYASYDTSSRTYIKPHTTLQYSNPPL